MADTKPVNLMDKIVALCKRRGFVFQSSEIYGGINGFWDYGPMGAELKRNVRDAWWNDTVRRRTDVVGIDGTIITHPRVWEASGHVTSFSDPMVDCKKCKGRWRADQLPETKCPEGGPHDYTEARQFNLMFESHAGPVKDDSNKVYLRPETAQVIFVQFQNVLSVSRQKIPFGIAQIGKAFRNEINPRNFLFRSREFEQMEIEYFIAPDADWQKCHRDWIDAGFAWLESIGLPRALLSEYAHPKEKLSHYSKGTVDIMFKFPFGVQELCGFAARGDFDLSQHQKFSGKSMEYFDEVTKKKYVPHVVEPSLGVDRILLAALCAGYAEDEAPDEKGKLEKRVVLRLSPRLAPVKVAVLPLVKNKPELVAVAEQLHAKLQRKYAVFYDQSGAIGRRYRRQDEIGTPWCVTIDFDTLANGTFTLRARDSMKQERIDEKTLFALLNEKLD